MDLEWLRMGGKGNALYDLCQPEIPDITRAQKFFLWIFSKDNYFDVVGLSGVD
jgi:hypothetical protein